MHLQIWRRYCKILTNFNLFNESKLNTRKVDHFLKSSTDVEPVFFYFLCQAFNIKNQRRLSSRLSIPMFIGTPCIWEYIQSKFSDTTDINNHIVHIERAQMTLSLHNSAILSHTIIYARSSLNSTLFWWPLLYSRRPIYKYNEDDFQFQFLSLPSSSLSINSHKHEKREAIN